MLFHLTTLPGLEPIAADEAAGLGPGIVATPRPHGLRGRVAVEIEGVAPGELSRLRTIQRVVELRAEAEIDTLDEVRRIAGEVDLHEIDAVSTFRVTTERRGGHSFHGVDVQRAAGGALVRRHGTRVDLEAPALVVRFDLDDRRLTVGLERTATPLGKRILRPCALRSALEPTVAAAMLRLAGAHRGAGRLVDPLCGSGTILLEAAWTNPRLRIVGSDWDEATIAVARETARANGVALDLRVADARGLGEQAPGAYDFIVTDPPYGMRQGRRTSLTRFYASLLASFEGALAPGGQIAIIAVKHRVLRAALARTGLEIAAEVALERGGFEPRIFLLRRRES